MKGKKLRSNTSVQIECQASPHFFLGLYNPGLQISLPYVSTHFKSLALLVKSFLTISSYKTRSLA